ncbi:hypothetical protein [Tropicimonas sediminicola]|uniref:Sulfotransferase family protein n=1 Tax=Tropicimonas sediminicola TaxID=1031541 RepID=A0A239JMI2_9RHOB|nr:hypothetical protein [Tropicimonas sediminicola]SNT06979.1 hypothetical protein SAMN05421757_105360 [Tropicimonas sediminicola]
MFATAYLHIGTGKTGSSSIQATAHQSRDLLREFGYHYPSGIRNHFLLGQSFVDNPAPKRNHWRDGRTSDEVRAEALEYRARIEAEMATAETPNLILSSESFVTQDAVSFERLVDFLLTKARRVVVICYLRHPASLVFSGVQQHIKMGNMQLKDFAPDRNVRRWSEKLEQFGPALEKCELVLRPFDRAQLRGGDAVRDFFGILGLEDSQLDQLGGTDTNESLSHEAVLLADALNRIEPVLIDGRANPERARAPGAVFSRIRGQRFFLPPETREAIMEIAGPEADLLRERYGLDLPAPSFPPEADLWGPESVEDIARELNRLQRENERLQAQLAKRKRGAKKAGAA